MNDFPIPPHLLASLLRRCKEHYAETGDISLQNGLMGEAVFFYWLSRETHNALFEKKADGLLQEVVKKINARLPLDIPNGLLGVSLGICYLTHPRDVNGHFNSDIQRENAMMELRKTINSSKKGVHRQ